MTASALPAVKCQGGCGQLVPAGEVVRVGEDQPPYCGRCAVRELLRRIRLPSDAVQLEFADE